MSGGGEEGKGVLVRLCAAALLGGVSCCRRSHQVTRVARFSALLTATDTGIGCDFVRPSPVVLEGALHACATLILVSWGNMLH